MTMRISAIKIKILTIAVKAVPKPPRWLNIEPNSMPPSPPSSIPLTKLPLDEDDAELALLPETEFVFWFVFDW